MHIFANIAPVKKSYYNMQRKNMKKVKLMYNVLIADDEPRITAGMKVIIEWEELGFRVTDTALDGEEALEKIKGSDFNLVIADIRMPVLDGLQLIREIRALNPDIRVLIISGYDNFEYARKAIDYGVKGYLLKPIDREELMAYVVKIRNELDSERNINPAPRKSLQTSGIITEYADVNDNTDADYNREEVGDIKISGMESRLKEYVNMHYFMDLSLKSLAAVFYLNPVYLGRLFKQTLGESFSDYLNKVRIAEAKKMINGGNEKIYSVIAKVGYKNHEHFYRQFKKYEGISFAEYNLNSKRMDKNDK